MLFDTHAHLDDRAFDTDRETLLDGLADRQIALVMNPGCRRGQPSRCRRRGLRRSDGRIQKIM